MTWQSAVQNTGRWKRAANDARGKGGYCRARCAAVLGISSETCIIRSDRCVGACGSANPVVTSTLHMIRSVLATSDISGLALSRKSMTPWSRHERRTCRCKRHSALRIEMLSISLLCVQEHSGIRRTSMLQIQDASTNTADKYPANIHFTTSALGSSGEI